MTLKPVPIFGRSKVTSSIVITMNLEFSSSCRKKKTFPIPLKLIDASRTTHTSLDVLQEKRIIFNSNVDVDRTSSDSWTGFTKFTLLNEKPPQGDMWSGWRLTKIRATSRPDCLWPEIWIGQSKAAEKKEKQQSAMEKPKLDNARKLRGRKVESTKRRL